MGYYRDSSGAGGQPTGKFLLWGARWYDPTLGRFLSRDPLGYQAGQNMYAYCGGNPITHADPSGMDDEGPGGDAAYTSDFHPDIGGVFAAMDFLDAGLQCVPFYNTATAITGRDVWGRCLSGGERISRGIMGALSDVPILGEAAGEIKCWITGGCFTAGAPVVMKDGTTKPVQSVEQGDEVLSKDEKTGRMEARRVEQVSRRTVGRVVRVTLSDPVTHQSQTLTATEDHPFYVQGKGFVPAGQLGVGTSIVTRAGPALTVSGSAFLPQQVGGYVVYNLTVEGDHTYFVGSVDGGAWVHNNTCTLSQEGIDQIANHLDSRGMSIEYNDAAIDRLQGILDRGEEAAGYDKNFYEHELYESELMSQGLEYDEAHAAAMKKYGVTDYDLYHPSIVSRFSGWFSPGYPRE